MKILFKYATRSRPELFKRGIESIINNVESEDYKILVSVDSNDDSMNGVAHDYLHYSWIKIADNRINCKNIKLSFGDSKNKIEAVNRDVNEFNYDWDILVNMSDDMVFNVKGFDNIIRENFYFKKLDGGNSLVKDLDKCLHFPDGNRKDLITMSIMGRDYYNRFNYIYHPDYISLYCDNEQTEVAKMLGCYKYVDKQIFEHLHPAYGKAVFDAQYQHTESFGNVDLQTYLKRKEANFGIK